MNKINKAEMKTMKYKIEKEKVNETQSWFFKRINKIDRSLESFDTSSHFYLIHSSGNISSIYMWF